LLLFRDNIHIQFIVPRVLADNHALIDFRCRCNENSPSFLQVRDGEPGGNTSPVRDERTSGTHLNVTLPLDVPVKERIHNRHSLCIGQHLAADSDEAARWNVELETYTTR